jgi:hypothetical protein
MDQASQYGQMDFNLPHDVVSLPSKGIFYKPKKESLKVGFLTASDENLLMSQNIPKEGLITTLLKNKIYEPGFDVTQMIDVDVQAVLLFLRNTAFGPEYNYIVTDPATGRKFDVKLNIDEVNYLPSVHKPDIDGFFSAVLPKSNGNLKCKVLSVKESNEIDSIQNSYPDNMIAPVMTKRLESQIVELNGERDKGKIAQFVNQMPISDSKYLRKFLRECEPKLDLLRTITAPSGEKVAVEVTFGAEFFRPFFSV